MTISIWVLGVSGLLLLFFGTLFKVEGDKEGRILLVTAREWLDEKLMGLIAYFYYKTNQFGRGSVRLVLHFFVHLILDFLLGVLSWFTGHIHRLQRRNKSVAKSVKEERERTHLTIIAEHKASSSLSEEEKQDLKDRSIGV